MLSHSFSEQDVSVLLHPVAPVFLTVEEKERQIQNGVHYSRILSKESAPKPEYLALFDEQVNRFGPELANDVLSLAGMIACNRENPVIVSLVRAGTPIGVILRRILLASGIDAPHYTVSIVRDRGLDMAAIEHILDQGHSPASLVFVDGWTGKGVIRRELSKSINQAPACCEGLKDELYVVGDIAGVADFAATRRDTLIPSCLLNATVSGLISRSVTRDDVGSAQHGGTYLNNLVEFDRSQSFVEIIAQLAIDQLKDSGEELSAFGGRALRRNFVRKRAASEMSRLIKSIEKSHGIRDVNRIKPGIGESSRVLLRRVPDALIVRSLECDAVKHLLLLANERNVPVVVMPDMPINAVALIKDVGNE